MKMYGGIFFILFIRTHREVMDNLNFVMSRETYIAQGLLSIRLGIFSATLGMLRKIKVR